MSFLLMVITGKRKLPIYSTDITSGQKVVSISGNGNFIALGESASNLNGTQSGNVRVLNCKIIIFVQFLLTSSFMLHQLLTLALTLL